MIPDFLQSLLAERFYNNAQVVKYVGCTGGILFPESVENSLSPLAGRLWIPPTILCNGRWRTFLQRINLSGCGTDPSVIYRLLGIFTPYPVWLKNIVIKNSPIHFLPYLFPLDITDGIF